MNVKECRKGRFAGGMHLTPLRSQNAHRQAELALVLVSIVPALAFFYLGSVLHGAGEELPASSLLIIFICVFIVAVAGYIVLRKYPQNIIKLRHYITEVADGTLPDHISLDQVGNSDDLKYIEVGFNAILEELASRLRQIEEKFAVESSLRKALEKQQNLLVRAEQHRVMIQSLGAACHHLGQPATVLRMHLYLLKEKAHTLEEMEEIEQSIEAVDAMEAVFRKLREVQEYRTEAYLADGEDYDSEILAI